MMRCGGKLTALILVCLWPLAAHCQDAPLRFGVFPNLSARVLLEVHQPLADYLSSSLKRPVNIETAPDCASFVARTRKERYDLVLTPPHLAYLAVEKNNYRPLYTYKNPIRGLLAVRADSPIHELNDMKGKTIAMPDAICLVSMVMKEDLKRAGLLEGRDFKVIEAGTHNNAALLVQQRKADGGVMGLLPFQRLPEEVKDSLRPLAFTRWSALSQVYLASPRLPEAEVKALAAAIAGFVDTAPGRAFIQDGDMGGLMPVSTTNLKMYKPFGDEVADKLRARRRP
jgi:ABC-type phosphate/phosphonate transport system substrate-binding protein